MNKKFLKYYAPLLARGNKTAFMLYCYYDTFKDSEGIVVIKTEKLISFLGLNEKVFERANRVLAGLNLIEIVDKKIYCREIEAPKKENKVQTKSAKALCNDAAEQEKKILKLLSMQFMKKLYAELGPDQFRMKHILVKLDIDKEFFLEKKKDKYFLRKLKQIVETIKKKDEPEDHYGSLLKSIEAVSLGQWKTPHLLGYFVKKYEEVFNIRFAFSSHNVFNSKEMRDVKRLRSYFDSAVEVKEYIDWFYEVKRREPGIRSVGTGILVYAGMINEYKQKRTASGTKTSRNGILDKSFIDWVNVNAPEVLERFTLQTLEDLSWIIDAAKHNESDQQANKVMQEAQRRGMINATA